MKKLLIFAALCAAFVSCKKEAAPDKPDITVVNVDFVMNRISSDILRYYDVEYTYTDFSGATQTETITGTSSYRFKLNNPKLTSKASDNPFKISLVFTPKDGVQPKESGSYDASINYWFRIVALTSDGSSVLGSGNFHTQECTSKGQTYKHFCDYVNSFTVADETLGLTLSLNNINEWVFGWDYIK